MSGEPAEGGGGETMQIDAFVDDFEEVDAPDLGVGAPPPLPPKRVSRVAWIAGGLVVLLAVGLGVVAGSILLSGDASDEDAQDERTAAAAEPPVADDVAEEEAADEPAADGAEPGSADDFGDGEAGEGDPNVVRIDDIVFE